MSKMKNKESEIKLGYCPHCNSDNYDVVETNYYNEGKPYVCADCRCNNCPNIFTEYYGIDEVKFDKEDEEQIYTNSLSDEDKTFIADLLEIKKEELIKIAFKSNQKKTKDKIERIIKIMRGGLIKE